VDELADILKALADGTRLEMLALLSQRGELCVCDFERALSVSQSSASRHLRNLLHAGLLQARREGTWMHYRISTQLTPEREAILASLRSSAAFHDLDLRVAKRLDDWLADKARAAAAQPSCGCNGSLTPPTLAGLQVEGRIS
jgi:ArsR family transcriptional regulator, arsenate/arsenite/antimonite-responsive transcriptional repressor